MTIPEQKAIYDAHRAAVDEVFTADKRKALDKVLEDIMALSSIKKMMMEGKVDQAMASATQLIEEVFESQKEEYQPVLITCKDGTTCDLTRICMIAMMESKLHQHTTYRNDAATAFRVGVGIVIGCIGGYFLF